MRDLRILFDNNRKWVENKTREQPDYFKQRAEQQDPLYLWFGCSDSRVPANEIVGLEPGELFVCRNVANVFPHTDFNCLSVLEYAVSILKVKHVIVCGHYGCGGVKAAMEDHHLGLVDNWLRHIRDVYALHKNELDGIANLKKRYERLVQLNVLSQVLNICHTTIVQEAWARHQKVSVHGWVYNMETGGLEDLNCCISDSGQIEAIYKIKLG